MNKINKLVSELFKGLCCGLTNDHIVKEPITLSCGHCICKHCVPDQVKIKDEAQKTRFCKINEEGLGYFIFNYVLFFRLFYF